MPDARVNGVRLHFEETGEGEPLLLVHGSWGDHASWSPAVPGLAAGLKVVRYDRRGHSESERPEGEGSVHEDVADAAALLEHAGLAPAHVVGHSYGACIALRLAAVRPDVVRGVAVHEPPFFGLLRGSPEGEAAVASMRKGASPVLRLIEAGRHAEAAQRFVEDIAFGPGAWAALPPPVQRVMTQNAPTWLDEYRDPDALSEADAETLGLRRIRCPVLLTGGDRSPPFYARILDAVQALVPHAARHAYTGAGHVPHLTHTSAFVERIRAFAATGESHGKGT